MPWAVTYFHRLKSPEDRDKIATMMHNFEDLLNWCHFDGFG